MKTLKTFQLTDETGSVICKEENGAIHTFLRIEDREMCVSTSESELDDVIEQLIRARLYRSRKPKRTIGDLLTTYWRQIVGKE